MKALYPTAAAACLMLAIPAAAQTGPSCCQNRASAAPSDPVPYLVGRVDRNGSRLVVADGQQVELFVTEQQAAEVPRRVDLRRYRGRTVIVLCQPWHVGSDQAWGCEAIGPLAPTVGIRTRR